jgi:hypothetical protein
MATVPQNHISSHTDLFQTNRFENQSNSSHLSKGAKIGAITSLALAWLFLRQGFPNAINTPSLVFFLLAVMFRMLVVALIGGIAGHQIEKILKQPNNTPSPRIS